MNRPVLDYKRALVGYKESNSEEQTFVPSLIYDHIARYLITTQSILPLMLVSKISYSAIRILLLNKDINNTEMNRRDDLIESWKDMIDNAKCNEQNISCNSDILNNIWSSDIVSLHAAKTLIIAYPRIMAMIPTNIKKYHYLHNTYMRLKQRDSIKQTIRPIPLKPNDMVKQEFTDRDLDCKWDLYHPKLDEGKYERWVEWEKEVMDEYHNNLFDDNEQYSKHFSYYDSNYGMGCY